MIVFKNMFSFGLTFAAYDWLKGGGVSRIFCILASLQLAICLLSIPMCKLLIWIQRPEMRLKC